MFYLQQFSIDGMDEILLKCRSILKRLFFFVHLSVAVEYHGNAEEDEKGK